MPSHYVENSLPFKGEKFLVIEIDFIIAYLYING